MVNEVLSIKEATERLKCHRNFIAKLVRKKLIIRIGVRGFYRYDKDSIDRFLNSLPRQGGV